MQPGPFHTVTYSILSWLRVVTIVALIVFSIAPLGYVPLIDNFKWLIDTHGKTVNATLVAILGAIELIIKSIGQPWMWECVKGILDGFQRDIFQDVGDGALADHYRVTLYRYQKWRFWLRGRGPWYWPWGKGLWPWSGWLVPVVRAGPDSAGSTVFPYGQQFEGVCGAAFSQQSGTLELKSIPNITAASQDAEVKEYAKRTFVSEEMVRARIKSGRPCARYFLAHRVEVQSVKWGVLMIDCRSESLSQPQVALHRFSQIRDALDHLLRRV